MSHWTAPYLAGRGVQGGCWDFARIVWRDHYCLDVPEFPIPGTPLDAVRTIAEQAPKLGWCEVQRPEDGDGVLMARVRFGAHVGVYVGDLGRVLHRTECGVYLHNDAHLDYLRWRRRFFRYGA